MAHTLSDKYTGFFDNAGHRRVFFWFIMAIGIFARIYRFGLVPAGINQDEAFAGYEAWSLLNYGIDTAGYHNPVYLIAWGSGMNALETYLMIPFIALFGLEVWVIRLPQVIVACLSLPTVYGLVKRTVNERAGLLAMFMLAICPWHIILSRWGLESNLAPGFLLFGLYFFVRGVENPRFLPLSALMYGLSLYTYATIWPFVPLMLVIQLIYCMAHKKIRLTRHLVWSGVILFILALPLLLFLAVNYGWIDEIITPFFSIPELYYMRSGDLSLDEKAKKLEIFLDIFFYQNDKKLWNSPEKYGLFYYITIPFVLLGLVFCVRELIKARREKRFCPAALLLVQGCACLPLLLLIKGNATKFNIFFIPLVIFAALGIYFLSEFSLREFGGIVAAAYLVLFAGFTHYYFTDYAADVQVHYSYGLDEALELAGEKGEKVYIDQDEFYTKVLFYTKTPVTTFRDTVEYLYFPTSYLHALSFDRYYFWVSPYDVEENAAYIISYGDDLGLLPEAGFSFERFGNYIVAYKEK